MQGTFENLGNGFNKIMLPKEMWSEQSLQDPRNHKLTMKKVTVVGWQMQDGIVHMAYYRSQSGDLRVANLVRPIGYAPYLVEELD